MRRCTYGSSITHLSTPADALAHARMTLPLGAEGKRLRAEAWAAFMAAP